MLCLMLLSLPARAQDLFSDPCARAGIPRDLAVAIARQESSLTPFAVNVQGREIRPRSYEEAARIIMEAHQAGKSYDVGIMQINSQWTRRWKMNPLDLLDPKVNISLGVSILEQEIRRYGMGWLAVGKYHSPNLERGRRYAWRIYHHMKEKKDEALFASGKTPENNSESLYHGNGVWRNHGIKRKGRLITFRVREEGLPGQPDHQPGGSTGPKGIAENQR